jgi:TonB family protein
MQIRTLLGATAALVAAFPAMAQEAQKPSLSEEMAKGKRIFAPAPLGYGGKTVPRPISTSQDWVTNADYPLEAWRRREEGVVQYDLAIDAQGQVAGCKITYSTATPDLEAATCRLLSERARFKPAEGEDGNPRASVYPGEMTWQLREPEYTAPFTVKVAFTLDERGMQRNCRIVERSGTITPDMQRTLDKRPCPSNFGLRGVPYRDAEGRPVAREVTVTYGADLGPAPAAAPSGN